MVAYLFVEVIAMVLHHVMRFCLSNRRVITKSYSRMEISKQALIGAAGNAIVTAVSKCLTVHWHMRSSTYKCKEL